MNTEKELEDIGDFISAAITKVTRPETLCETVSVSRGNGDVAVLSVKDDGLWLTLKTPRGSASFNLEFKLDYHDTRKSSISERVAVDYFKRIK